MPYTPFPQTLLGGAGTLLTAAGSPTLVFQQGPVSGSGADTWQAFFNYTPGATTPTLTDASGSGISFTLSSPTTDFFYNYAQVSYSLPLSLTLGTYYVGYSHDFTGRHAGRFTSANSDGTPYTAFLAASDWNVITTAPSANVVQGSDGSIAVPLLFTLISAGSRVSGSGAGFMRFSADGPNTDATSSANIGPGFVNSAGSGTSGGGPTRAITHTFHGPVVTAPTAMTVTLDNLIPSSGSGTWLDFLLYNQTHTVSVTIYPPGSTPGGGSGVGGSPTVPAVALSAVLNNDAHRRPLAALSGGTAASPTLSAAYSNDAGHTFVSASLGAGADPSLLVDTRRNVYRIPFSTGSGLSQHSGSLQDGYVEASGSPSALTGLSGKYPAAAQHPTDRDYALLAYLDGSTLKTAYSADAGATWTYLSTVATGVDFTSSGRSALCWLGNLVLLASGPGPALLVRKSLDRGLTWAAPVTVATAPANPNYTAAAYSGLSLLGWQGKLSLLAWGYGSTGTTLSPSLWLSETLGAIWAASAGSLPSGLTPPSALGVIPQTGQLRLGLTHKSDNDGLTWTAD